MNQDEKIEQMRARIRRNLARRTGLTKAQRERLEESLMAEALAPAQELPGSRTRNTGRAN